MSLRTFSVKAVLAAGALSLSACSTVDRFSNNDYGVYSGTRMSTEKSTGMFDTFGSAIGDTVLLPFTGTAWLFGYRYQDPQAPNINPSSVAPK